MSDVEPIDPNAPVPFAMSETMTFAEWCALDPALADADKAAYAELYPAPVVDPTMAPPAEPVVPSAFVTYFGSRADQKMDRATLDLRMQEMRDALKPA